MTAHVNLGLVFHQHQPVGNYGFVFDDLFQNSYEPLVACLERHPGVKAGLHYSGPLLDWLRVNRPGYLERVQSLVARGQVDVLGGGYYEPILPAISEADRIGQMAKMRESVAETFGRTPTGMWLPERVWEPELPSSIAAAGYRWTIVDDVHFEGAGFRAGDLHGWYLTESDGARLGVFGSSTEFRYLVPWGTVDACIDFLRQRGAERGGSLVTMGDDGEKFGGWPTTHLHCWENGWVDAFFSRLEQESHWISTAHLGQWREEHPPESLAYLPSTSYMEMGEWSLPASEQRELERAKSVLRDHGAGDLVRFLRGGHWRNFLVRYPEVNLLHKRLLVLSQEAHERGDAEALDHIWRAQCNCPFWHGVFGGVYLEHIRHANFSHMAQADAILHPGPESADVRDWDFDGQDEVCLRSARHAVIVAPAAGGAIEHWDLRPEGWHLTHAIARRPEAYHTGLGAGEGDEVRSIHDAVRVKDEAAVAQALVYDRGLRLAAQDTVLQNGAGRDAYREQRQASPPRTTRWSAAGHSVELYCRAGEVSYRKRVAAGAALHTRYELPVGATLFSEWNLSLPAGEGGGEPAFTFSPGCVRIATGEFRLTASHDAADAWVDRLYSVSNTEDGVELAPQGWSVIFSASERLDVRWSVAQ